MEKKTRMTLVISLATLGMISTVSGTILNMKAEEGINTDSKIVFQENVKITPVTQTVKVNQSLPSSLRSYIKENISDEVLDKIVLDTSKVDISKVGTYEYTLTYQKQILTGTVIVEDLISSTVQQTEETENAISVIAKITLKDITLKKGETLPSDITYYIEETLDSETLNQIQLALPSQGVTKQTGTYTYNASFNNMVYTATITVLEDQPVQQKVEVIEKDDDPSQTINQDTEDAEEAE